MAPRFCTALVAAAWGAWGKARMLCFIISNLPCLVGSAVPLLSPSTNEASTGTSPDLLAMSPAQPSLPQLLGPAQHGCFAALVLGLHGVLWSCQSIVMARTGRG